jgi:HD superfamily phosphohydrolase
MAKIIIEQSEKKKIIEDLSNYIVKDFYKGKIPLFITGYGISSKLNVPSMTKMIEKVFDLFISDDSIRISKEEKEDIIARYKIWRSQVDLDQTIDRNNVAAIFNYFQDKDYLKKTWVDFNNWLLNQCVNEEKEIGIRECKPSVAHEKIAELYEKVNALCLTLNFDGLLFRALKIKYRDQENIRIHSYYKPEDLQLIFSNTSFTKNNYFEIQLRGDIFFANCDPSWCKEFNDPCEERFKEPIRIWESNNNLYCNRKQSLKPYISFPGSFEKDREIKRMLEIIWKYLAFKVSCIITIGASGSWDPLLMAFLSDLARERNITIYDINIEPNKSMITKEVAMYSLKMEADAFMKMLSANIDSSFKTVKNNTENDIIYSPDRNAEDDKFWDEKLHVPLLKTQGISEFELMLINHNLVNITQRFAQLGLKSKWWEVPTDVRKKHNRLNHSKGTMKIATVLYEHACYNSHRKEKSGEKQLLRIAALLHDIGHLPFSHLIEDVFHELNWRPIEYTEYFTHDYYTKEKILEIFSDEKFLSELNKIGYEVKDLIDLIHGEFGIGFLDAIINGPIDADKIDYIYRDAESTNITNLREPNELLSEITKGIQINQYDLLMFQIPSDESARTVLNQRRRLYEDLYLQPCIRLLEKAVKLIIITYFVHKYNTVDLDTKIKNKFINDAKEEKKLADFGPIRIAMATNELQELSNKFKSDPEKDIEMAIIDYMINFLKTRPISKNHLNAINKCYELITEINNSIECRKKYQEKIVHSNPIEKKDLNRTYRTVKTVALRVPGALLLDIVEPFEYFKSIKNKKRSDGTVAAYNCLHPIFIEDIINYQNLKKEIGKLYVFAVDDKGQAKSALQLFHKIEQESENIFEE